MAQTGSPHPPRDTCSQMPPALGWGQEVWTIPVPCWNSASSILGNGVSALTPVTFVVSLILALYLTSLCPGLSVSGEQHGIIVRVKEEDEASQTGQFNSSGAFNQVTHPFKSRQDFPGFPPANGGSWIWSVIREDLTCRGATKPVNQNHWACTLEPTSHHNKKPANWN